MACRNRFRSAVPAAVVAAAILLAAAGAHGQGQDRSTRSKPSPFGPSVQSPYNFAPPAPIYPTPGGSLFEAPYQGANGYARKDRGTSAAPARNAPESRRLDTRIGPAK